MSHFILKFISNCISSILLKMRMTKIERCEAIGMLRAMPIGAVAAHFAVHRRTIEILASLIKRAPSSIKLDPVGQNQLTPQKTGTFVPLTCETDSKPPLTRHETGLAITQLADRQFLGDWSCKASNADGRLKNRNWQIDTGQLGWHGQLGTGAGISINGQT